MARIPLVAVLCVTVCATRRLHAQQPKSVEAVYSSQSVTANYGDWSETSMRIRVPVTARMQLVADGTLLDAFREHGAYGGLGLTFDVTPRWSVFVSGGASDNSPVLARARGDVQMGFTVISRTRLNVGAGLVDGFGPFRDKTAFASLAVYFPKGFVAEGGARLSESTPGDVRSSRGFGALTWSDTKHREIVIAGSSGGEGYQTLSADRSLLRFASSEIVATARIPVSAHIGVVARYTRYRNRFYERSGPGAGLTVRW